MSVSHWWKNVSLPGSKFVEPLVWFASPISNIVRNSLHTRFWHDVWIESTSFCLPFRGYSLSFENKFQVVVRMGNWARYFGFRVSVGGIICLSKRLMFQGSWLDSLRDWLNWIKGDACACILDSKGEFILNFVYDHIFSLAGREHVGFSDSEYGFLRGRGESRLTYVIMFSWKLLQNRMFSKQNIGRLRIISIVNGMNCVMCLGQVKLVHHHFIHIAYFVQSLQVVVQANCYVKPLGFSVGLGIMIE